MEKADRDALLAQLAAHPSWPVLKELMQQNARFRPVDFEHHAWQGILLHGHAQSEFVVQIIRTVEKAAEVAKTKTQVVHE